MVSKKASLQCLNIAGYLRLSQEDGSDIESNSIKNQRELIRNYLAGHPEFTDAKIIDYVDDGFSGSHTDRDAYKQLMTDVERGEIDCIVVKDLSRIGRDLIDVDDLLMNYLVTLNVRFIAINNGYDSFNSPLSNLELAVINLANQHYNKDLVQKSKTAKEIKTKRGEHLAHAPFGYIKSKTEKNKLVPDEEAAGYVKLIFSLASEGKGTVEIAQILNAQRIPSPSVYKVRNGWNNMWTQVIDPKYCFWSAGVIYKLLKNEVYIGSVVANKLKVVAPGKKRAVSQPRDEWIIVMNAHEPLVSEDMFEKAQLIFKRKKKHDTPDNIFGSKIKCPKCNHTMARTNVLNPRYKCGTVKVTEHYGCLNHIILQSEIDQVVLAAINKYVDILLDREEILQEQIKINKSTASELERKIAAELMSIETLEASVTKVYTSLVTGKISEDEFLRKKGMINETIDRKRVQISEWGENMSALNHEQSTAIAIITDLAPLKGLCMLTREVVDLLIDKILIHSETDIEIIWNGKFI